MFGVYKELNGDIMFDPLFHVTAKFDEDKISEVCVNQCTEETALGHTIVDCDNMLHGFGQVTKDPYGLKKRFCIFLINYVLTIEYTFNYNAYSWMIAQSKGDIKWPKMNLFVTANQ